MSTGLVGLQACVADLHPDAIILVHTHDSYIQDDMSHRCDLLTLLLRIAALVGFTFRTL